MKTVFVIILIAASFISNGSGMTTFGPTHHTIPPHDIRCDGRADGLLEFGCWGYAECLKGTPQVFTCHDGLVLDRDSVACVPASNTICGVSGDGLCDSKADGHYPHPGDCNTFYRCADNAFMGRFYCPHGTAFNVVYQVCDWPVNLLPPCGNASSMVSPHIHNLRGINCEGKEDGLQEFGCWGYAICMNGHPRVYTCAPGMALDRESMTCVFANSTACSLNGDTQCDGKADGHYPDSANCYSFYRCADEGFVGRYYCPRGTAFNEDLQVCDWPFNISPPCDTA